MPKITQQGNDVSRHHTGAGPPDLAQMAALAQNYGLEFGEPPWLADIMSRYDLTPPPSSA